MLGKLLKYEIPALGRKLVPLYIAWAATAALLGIMVGPLAEKSEFMMVISIMLYSAMAAAVFVMAVVIIVQRYKNSLLGDEGYFNHVLPVSVSAHIANKTISSLVWVLLSFVAFIVTGIVIAIFGGGLADLLNFEWRLFFGDLLDNMSVHVVLIIIEVIVLTAVSICKSVLTIYAALTIGHQASSRTSLASIGAYIGLMTLESMIGRLLMPLVPDSYYLNGDIGAVHLMLIGIIVVTAAVGAAYFFVCKELLEKRLNLN